MNSMVQFQSKTKILKIDTHMHLLPAGRVAEIPAATGDGAQQLACYNRSWGYEKIFDPRVIYFPAKSF